ncbi:MAG: glycosyltransferase [Desulfuromonadaceae bacterium]|nr:glycosyltransferase [Desulfuromonas sp.]MDY0186139.1 glycosyltransferase [Desulfuromonadaceae bacterium]
MADEQHPWVLQLCHGYDGPFLDCARQYAVLFKDTPYNVCTAYLTGEPDKYVEEASASAEVLFLNYTSAQIRGLKLSAIQDIKRLNKKHMFKFCIAHRYKATYIALLATQLPVFGISHAFGDYARFSRQIMARIFHKRLNLLGVSNAVRDDIRQKLHWPAKKIEALYNRIDVQHIQALQVSRDQARTQLQLPQDAWIVANVGRLHPDKDQATLIRGFAHALPDLQPNSLLVIMGKGRLEDELKALAKDLDIEERVVFLGQVPNARRYFKAFDVFALTSDHEPFGMVLLEAMAAGVPIICSDCGGGREVVDGCGLLFPLGDAIALAEKIIQMKHDFTTINCDNSLNRFSDEAARDKFWSLDAVRAACR